jgi:hypothetical protein
MTVTADGIVPLLVEVKLCAAEQPTAAELGAQHRS